MPTPRRCHEGRSLKFIADRPSIALADEIEAQDLRRGDPPVGHEPSRRGRRGRTELARAGGDRGGSLHEGGPDQTVSRTSIEPVAAEDVETPSMR
jgi:hypothetical protein